MKASSGQKPEMSDFTPDIVLDHLQTVGWGTETYPAELLELHHNEAHILQQVSNGMSLKDISRTEGLPYSVTAARYYAAEGKQDAKNSLDMDVTRLSPLAQRIVVLNSLFGATWDGGNGVIVSTEPEIVLTNARALDEMLGDKWLRCPQLAIMGTATLRERVGRYDSVLHPNWRNSPVLLTQSPGVVEERAAIYDSWFGKSWQMRPSILTNDPKTVISSARAMKTLGITQENIPPGTYFALLGTTVANKRKKAAFIRREILGHKQVHIHETKKPITEIIRLRQGQTLKDRELEALEIEAFKAFVRRMGAMGLVRSVSVIKNWADSHGY